MGVKNTVSAIPLGAIAANTFTGAYQLIGGLPQACFMLRFINNTSEDVIISYDGVNDNDVVIHDTTTQIPVQTNSQPNNFTCLFAKGLTIYVKAANGTGEFYVAGYYQQNENQGT
jgi:hypothetical protein